MTNLQTIDFWGSIEAHPTCLAEDCSKYAAFDGYCHLHSSSNPCPFACCTEVSHAQSGHADEAEEKANENGVDDDLGEIEAALSQTEDEDCSDGEADNEKHGVDVDEDDVDPDADLALAENDEQLIGGDDDSGDQCDASNVDEHERSSLADEQQVQPAAAPWEDMYSALSTYVDEHGHPPQAREDNPALFDWVQQQSERQRQMQLLFNSC